MVTSTANISHIMPNQPFFTKVIAMTAEPWMKHDNGDYSAEISCLERYFPHPYLPHTRLLLKQFTPHKDSEGEITHWTYKNNTDTFEIFND